MDELLGAFVNTLALRTDLTGDPSFSGALDRAKVAATQAFAHGMAPFARVVDTLGAVRSAAFTPVYQVPAQHSSACARHCTAMLRRASKLMTDSVMTLFCTPHSRSCWWWMVRANRAQCNSPAGTA